MCIRGKLLYGFDQNETALDNNPQATRSIYLVSSQQSTNSTQSSIGPLLVVLVSKGCNLQLSKLLDLLLWSAI